MVLDRLPQVLEVADVRAVGVVTVGSSWSPAAVSGLARCGTSAGTGSSPDTAWLAASNAGLGTSIALIGASGSGAGAARGAGAAAVRAPAGGGPGAAAVRAAAAHRRAVPTAPADRPVPGRRRRPSSRAARPSEARPEAEVPRVAGRPSCRTAQARPAQVHRGAGAPRVAGRPSRRTAQARAAARGTSTGAGRPRVAGGGRSGSGAAGSGAASGSGGGHRVERRRRRWRLDRRWRRRERVRRRRQCVGQGAAIASNGAGGGGGAKGSTGGGGGSRLFKPASASSTTLRGVAPDSGPPQVGQAPLPWVASTRSATAICSSLVARCAAGAYSPPPCDRPGARGELKAALIAVAGVDGPVAAGFAAGDLVPLAVGGGTCLPGEGEASATDDCAREGDLRDVYGRCSGLAMPSTHRCAGFLSSTPARSAVGFGLERLPGRRRRNDAGFTPRSRNSAPGPTCSVDRWVPRLRPKLFVVGWSRLDGARRDRGTAGHPIEVEGLGSDRNGSVRWRHLLPVTAFPRTANPKEALNPQEFRVFLQVFPALHHLVASL